MHTHKHTHTRTYTKTHTQTQIRKHTHTHINTREHIYTHTHTQIHTLKNADARNLWKGVKTLTGMNENPKFERMANSITNGNVEDLANHINIFLKSVSDDLKLLADCSKIFDNVDAEPVQTNDWIDSEDVSSMLSNIKGHEAHGSDGLPN